MGGERIVVTCPSRLHFGLLGPPEGRGVRLGGLGLALEEPRLVIEAERADALEAEGPQAERALAAARRFLSAAAAPAAPGEAGEPAAPRGPARRAEPLGARIVVREAIPEHVGLGSGTQMALAVAAALSRLLGLPGDVPEWCAALDRGRRSGVGAHAFRLGGFLLDAGRAEGAPVPPPLLFRQPFPEEWGILGVLPRQARGASGAREERLFGKLPAPPDGLLERLSGTILMHLLPALLERDVRAFGTALARVQEGVGRCFESAQGGLYHPQALPAVRWLRDAGALGVGQSSWGPCVYAFAPDRAGAQALARRFRAGAPGAAGCDVLQLRARNRGAEVSTEGGT
jgi:beta-RFAP synthase